jgi:phosphoglycolate phosphatase-like HAD superfamily hydrolase
VPIFMVERNFAEVLEPSLDLADGINRINAQEGVQWLYSFLSADKRKTYCLYEAPSPESIRAAATRAGIPADAVIEVGDRWLPNGASSDI